LGEFGEMADEFKQNHFKKPLSVNFSLFIEKTKVTFFKN